jgi:hypothetical protein
VRAAGTIDSAISPEMLNRIQSVMSNTPLEAGAAYGIRTGCRTLATMIQLDTPN